MPLQATSGAASQDAFGGNGVAVVPTYIEDVFSSYLWTGTGASRTITNDIDLSTKGGLVWIKSRSAGENHCLTDTARTADFQLASSTTLAQTNEFNRLTAFTTSGFSLSTSSLVNASAATYVGWTFREQPKFFDIVTYTGNGATPRNIAHNLGSTPGCVIVKSTGNSSAWWVYHRSNTTVGTAAESYLTLNTTNAALANSGIWADTAPTSTQFTVGSSSGVNQADITYIAYIFAHDAGGFGLTGTDNVISCGSYTCVAYPGNVTVTLGYEPQWVMVKNATQSSNWVIYDNMRGMPGTVPPNPVTLAPDSSAAENGVTGDAPGISPTATGFIARAGLTAVSGSAGDKVIYIAIRRGPMKVPTTGTSVFSPVAYTGNGTNAQAITTGFVPDMVWWKSRSNGTDFGDGTLLIGINRGLTLNSTGTEGSAAGYYINTYNNTGFTYGTSDTQYNGSGRTYVAETFSRAPSFMDVVCYTGTGSYPLTINHNLGVVPELMIIKTRSSSDGWYTYAKPVTSPNANWYQNFARLDATSAWASDTTSFTSTPTSTTIPVASYYSSSGTTYVVYLFATCAGVSKVGSYTGTATTKQIDCGFTAGARFVLIKRTDSTGDWYVWDTARGIIAGNDPYLLLNSAAAEVTSTDYVDTYSAGFEISSTAPAAINANGGTYIFLAIA